MVVVVMEGKPSPHLKKVLKSYQLAAANTMSGPSPHLSTRYENSGGNSSSRNNSGGSSANSGSSSNNGKIPGNLYAMGKSGGIMISNGIPGNLLHQQLQAAKHLSSLSIPISIDNIKKDNINLLSSSSTRHCGEPQSFVPIRRSSGGPVEMSNGSRSTTADSQVKNALISRSKSSPASTSLSHNSNPNLNVTTITIPKSSHSQTEDIGNGSTTSSNATTPNNLTTSLKIQSVGNYVGAGGTINNIKFSPTSFKHRESSSAIIPSANNVLRSPSGTTGGIAAGRPTTATTAPTGNSFSSLALIRERDSSLPTQLPPPILSAPDRSFTEKKETILEGERISCFDIGGEMRLCFPQILKVVLSSRFSLHQINSVCDELQICCACCSAEQLEVLKISGIIPLNAPSCGLITKTDAERLVNSLLHRNPPKAAVPSNLLSPKDPKSHFRVFHKCFGNAKGIVSPHLYDKPDSLCIECVDCHGLFSPPRFVAHSDHGPENRTCHWGFDTANWRHYLMLCKEHDDYSRWEVKLAEFKSKFDHKRKEVRSSPVKDLDDHLMIKKKRCEPPVISPTFNRSPNPSLPSKLSSFVQCTYPKTEQTDLDQMKQMLLYRLGQDGACVNTVLDEMAKRISTLEKKCYDQEKIIKEVSQVKTGTGTELQTKVNTMEAELHSLKKQLLRRHESNQNKVNVKSEEM